MENSLLTHLPEFYGRFFPDLFRRSIPEESKATCNDCAMCPVSGEEPSWRQIHFLPDVKCCTYHPSLPNYLIGALLSSNDPSMEEGRRRIWKIIGDRVGVEPIGIMPSPKWSLLYNRSKSRSFGNSPALLCPYFEKTKGLCTIWSFREATCSTYFCKYSRGADGERFWNGVKKYLTKVETVLMWESLHRMKWEAPSPQYILDHMKASDSTLSELGPRDLEVRPSTKATYKELWGEWMGKEAQFYRKCYESVASLNEKDFALILGVEGKVLLNGVLESLFRKMTCPSLPSKLERNPELEVYSSSDGSQYSVIGYSNNDPTNISATLYGILAYFTGSSETETVLRKIESDHQVVLSEDLLRQLYQERILVSTEYGGGR